MGKMHSLGTPPSQHFHVFTKPRRPAGLSQFQSSHRAESATPLSFLEVGGRAWKVQLSNHLVFLVTTSIPKLDRDLTLSHLISINSAVIQKRLSLNNKRHSYHSGSSKGFRSSVL